MKITLAVLIILSTVHCILACDSTFDRNLCYCIGGNTDCKSNNLNSIPPVLVRPLGPLVRSMDFRYNNIKAIKHTDIKLLTGLQTLDLRENPLRCCDILPLKDFMDSNSNLQTVLGTCFGEDKNTYSVTDFSVFPTCAIVSDYCINITCEHGGTCVSGNRMFHCMCAPQFTGKMCELELCQPYPADVVFVIDCSTSLSEEYLNISKEYIISITKEWKIALNHFQIALVSFSGSVVVELPFDAQTTNISLITTIRSLELRGGRSEIMTGIQAANYLLRTKFVHPKFSVPKKYVVILTDGLPSTPSVISSNQAPEVTTIAVSIGYDVSHYFLKALTDDMSLAFPSRYPERLINYFQSTLIDRSCKKCQMSNRSDILFAVDVTSGIKELSKTIPDIVNDILPNLKLGPNDIQVALTTYDDFSNLRFKFSDYSELNRKDLQRQMSSYSPSVKKSSNITKLLENIEQVFFNSTYHSRDDSQKTVLIISNFKNPIESNDVAILKTLKNSGIDIFTIGLRSSDTSYDAMSHIASSSYHIGLVGNLYTSKIDSFIEAFIEQLHIIHCNV